MCTHTAQDQHRKKHVAYTEQKTSEIFAKVFEIENVQRRTR